MAEAMNMSEADAYDRIAQVARALDRDLVIDRGSVHWREATYPGVAFGASLGGAHALFFLPAADIAAPEWEDRVRRRLEAVHQYLAGFPARAR
jgi:hypothetical protein